VDGGDGSHGFHRLDLRSLAATRRGAEGGPPAHVAGHCGAWALEVGDVQRFSSIKKAISYCGLCGAEKSSGNTVQRTPLSKQRNKHLQTTLIEAAKMAPRNSSELAMLYDKEKQKGNANRATLAVARKLVAYLMAVDRGQRNFQVVETNCIAA
jgi:transposase